MDTAIEYLFQRLREVEPYPFGVRSTGSDRIQGLAFFPGGSGLWQKDHEASAAMPIGGIMVLGHDFHSEKNFLTSLKERGAERNPTWRILKRVLPDGDIQLSMCFFTNVYMGVREGESSTGRFPGSKDLSFQTRCLDFLRVQLEVQKPRLVITLGKWVPPLFAKLSDELSSWKSIKTFHDLDNIGPFVQDIEVRTAHATIVCDVLALIHPSMRASNIKSRRYGSFRGNQAEMEMLRQASARLAIGEA